MGKPAHSIVPRWILVGTGLFGLIAAGLVPIIRYYEIRRVSAEAERARIEAEMARNNGKSSGSPSLTTPAPSVASRGTPNSSSSPSTSAPPVDQPTPRRDSMALFNGRDLDGWSMVANRSTKEKTRNTWAADPDRRVLYSRGGDFQDLQFNREFRNFVLKLEWRFTPGGFIGANGSGVIIRARGLDDSEFNPRGIEVDFRMQKASKEGIGPGCFLAYGTHLANHWGKADGVKDRHLGCLREPVMLAEGKWNSCEVSCQGDRIQVWMNGVLVNEGWGADDVPGRICLRSQNTAVEFRDITVTPSTP